MRKLLENTIWAPGAIPADEWKFRNQKRIMFPVIDILFFFAGLSAARHAVPAISEFFPDEIVDGFAYLLSVVALICLVGVAYPRLWKIEIAGKASLFALMVGYFTSLLILTGQGSETRGFVLFVAGVAICPIVWRLSLLGSEWQIRRLQAAEAAAQNQGE